MKAHPSLRLPELVSYDFPSVDWLHGGTDRSTVAAGSLYSRFEPLTRLRCFVDQRRCHIVESNNHSARPRRVLLASVCSNVDIDKTPAGWSLHVLAEEVRFTTFIRDGDREIENDFAACGLLRCFDLVLRSASTLDSMSHAFEWRDENDADRHFAFGVHQSIAKQ